MAREKHMDESAYESIVKEINAFGELVRTHQDEKQAAMDQFDKERDRYHAGKISKKALASSVQKINKELKRLDALIRKDISNLTKTMQQGRKFVVKQAPRSLRVSLSGIGSSRKKK
ncbi:MAG: hypothetical protein AABX83_00975 [Nanoarchaeota archaeon]